MRYSIMGFNQEELIKYDIDMLDVLLLDYIQKAISQPCQPQLPMYRKQLTEFFLPTNFGRMSTQRKKQLSRKS